MKQLSNRIVQTGRNLVTGVLMLTAWMTLPLLTAKAQSPCDASFTGLPAQMCSADASALLVPTTPGGTFTGPGITGNSFNPSVAGVGTHTISYTVSQAAGATYAYSPIPYVAPPVVTNFVTLGDDQMSATLPIGFSFNFYGNNYTQFEISSNGFITFDLGTNQSGCCQGQLLPDAISPNNVIAAVWDDLYPPGNGTVGYGVFGTAPNQYLVVSWTSTPFCCGSTADVTTTIVIYETSNIIEIHSSFVNSASPATMGIESIGGLNGMAVPNYNQSTINIGAPEAHRFTPVAPCTSNTSTQTITVIQSPTVAASASNPNICPGVTTTLTATGANTYVWNPGNQTGASVSVSPNTTTIYTVTATGVNGCIVSATQSINVSAQLPITVTSNPAVLCGGSSATLTAGGATTYTWQPGNLSGTAVTVSPSVTTSYTVSGSDALGCTGSTIFSLPVAALNNMTITPNQAPCTDTLTVTIPGGAATPANGAKYYIRDTDPWATQNNTTAMTAVFGANNYTTTTFTVNPASVFNSNTQFVFLEGSDGNATALNTFYTANQTLIEGWVFNGGRLFLNAAPNNGGNMNWGFGGVTLNYNSAQGSVNAVTPLHPVFVGPFTPLATTYTGSSYSHAHITGGNTTAIITGGGVNVLTEKTWGSGYVMFGGITSPNFHTPAIEAQNLWQNIISYTANNATALSYTYSWSNGSTNSYTIPATAGTYTVTVTGNGCSGTASYTVNSVNPVVTATASPTSFCAGGSATLTGSGANTYTWQPGNLSGTTVTVTPNATTIYTVTGTNAGNCTAIDTLVVTVNPIPTVTIVQQGVNCSDSLKAVVTGLGAGVPLPGARYYIRDSDPWSTLNNTTAMTAVFGANNYITTTFSTAVPATVFSSGTQFVFLEGSDANATALNTFFTANQTLIENWVNNGGRLFLNAAPNQGGNMNWGFGGVTLNYNSAQSTVNAVSPTHPIFVGPSLPTATTLSGNSYSHAHITGGGTNPVIVGGGVNVLTEKTWGNGYVMFGGITSPNFHTPPTEAQNVWQNIINYTANGAAGGPSVTYLWSTNATTSFIVPPASGTYTVTVTANGCSATATYTATVNNPPVVSVSTNTPTICPGQTAVLIANGATSYTWQPGGLTGNAINANPSVTTTYTITGTSAGGCTASTVFTLNVSGQIPITATATPGTICLAGISSLQASGANTYTWQPGNLSGASISVSPNTTTTYTVTGTNANGCSGTTTVQVILSPNPTVTATASPSNSICQGDQVTLSGGGATTYTWSGGITNGVAFTPNVTTTYTVTGANAAGCTNNTTITVTVNPSVAPPALTISCVPFPAMVGTSTTYTANIPGSITNYTIRWYRNNAFYQQTTSPTNTLVFTPTGLQDSIHAQIIPAGCYNPDSVKTNSINPRFNTAVGDVELPEGFAVYPNPTHDQVNITGLMKGDELHLTDMVGRTLVSKTMENNEQFVISLKAYAQGVYNARFIRNNRSWTIRVVKE